MDLPGDQRNTASSHKESMRRTPPPMHPNTSGLQSGLQKQKRRQFSTNQRRFSWQRNTASSHKESMRRTPPPMHPNTSGLQSGLQKQKRRQFSTNQRRFSWRTDCNARQTLFFMFRHIRFCSAFHLHERFYDRVYFFFIPLCQLYEIKPSFCKRPTTMPSSISHLLAK